MSEPVAWQQGHRRTPWGQPKGRLSAQAAILWERARSQSTSTTGPPVGLLPPRPAHAPPKGAPIPPRHARSRALGRPHSPRIVCAPQELHTHSGLGPAPCTHTSRKPGRQQPSLAKAQTRRGDQRADRGRAPTPPEPLRAILHKKSAKRDPATANPGGRLQLRLHTGQGRKSPKK